MHNRSLQRGYTSLTRGKYQSPAETQVTPVDHCSQSLPSPAGRLLCGNYPCSVPLQLKRQLCVIMPILNSPAAKGELSRQGDSTISKWRWFLCCKLFCWSETWHIWSGWLYHCLHWKLDWLEVNEWRLRQYNLGNTKEWTDNFYIGELDLILLTTGIQNCDSQFLHKISGNAFHRLFSVFKFWRA